MSQQQPIPSDDLRNEVYDQVKDFAPDAVVEAIAVQLGTAREARERINREGSVVRDVKGSVIAHPAIKVEADAIKISTALLKQWAE